MSAMANTTPLVTTVTKPTTNPRDADATPRVNIQDFCEEYYEDILPIIMDKVRRDKRKEVHARTGDPEDHVKIFQAAAQVERWAMPTWCHMFNSTLIEAARVWFDEIPPESIYSYKNLKAAFLAYFMQQKKYVKDPVEIHNIKQTDGETIEDFMERFKVETGRMKGAPECMRISGFMHGVNNPKLTKRLNGHVPMTMEEIMITATAFIRGEAAAANKKKGHTSWKAHDLSKRQTLKKSLTSGVTQRKEGDLIGSPPTRMPKEILAAGAGHSKDECMQLKKQIKELVRAGKLSHLIKEIKHGRDQSKTGKKETPAKDKPTKIYMIQSWQRMTRQKVTQSFERVKEITFPLLTASSKVEGPLVKEVEMGGHIIHRMYVDGGSSMEILYEHCFNRLRPEMKNQMVPVTTSLTGFSSETIWPLGQLRLLVTIGDADHSTRAWMNFMIVRSLSPYNGIIGRPGIREIQAVPSTAHGMLKFPIEGGIEEGTHPENFKVALHPDFLGQEVAIRGTLSAKGRTELCSILKKNLDIFAWKPSDMTGVPQLVAEHRLNIQEDYYPLPEIDWKVESFCIYSFKCFLDAYKSYHKIQLAEPDEEKTAFHTGQMVYCYTKMPFGLKNAGATYQRLVDKVFDSQIGRNIEVYVDDLVVKSYTEAEMLRDIDEMFCTLRKINMKLNPKKCTFGAAEGVFLGYVVTLEGIKPFLSKSAEKSLPLFKTLKKCNKKSDFHWTAEAEQAFKQLKRHLSELPLLVVPKPAEELTIYQSATYGAISAVLMTERGATQTPIYFISRTLQGPELNYAPMEKLVLSLVFATKRLQRYFQAHPITVITDQPIKQITSRPDVAGRLQKWSVMLGEHNITYRPRKSVKGQILADFLTELPDENPPVAPVAEIQQDTWTLFTDGSSCVDGSASNNEAEYEALISGLRKAGQMGVENVHVSVDSKLVANQVLGTYVAKEENMIKYLDKVKSLTIVPYVVVKMCWTAPGEVIDIVGPFLEGPGKVKFLIVTMDYFTKWIEAKAVATITGEFGMPTYRIAAVDVVYNDEELRLNLDLLEERRERVAIREAKAKLKMTKYYNARVHGVTFRPGDFVYRSNNASHAVAGGKLGPKWEGPYEVTEALGDEAYKLRSTDETILPRTWNITNLKSCYL
nr:reverse transcriptase domain-containing protein [Tanacetum cinerariifolium]